MEACVFLPVRDEHPYHLWKFTRKDWSHEKLKRKGSYIRLKLELAEQLIDIYRKKVNKGRPKTAARETKIPPFS